MKPNLKSNLGQLKCPRSVAQSCTLLYRRIVHPPHGGRAFCEAREFRCRKKHSRPCQLQIGETAECNSALRFLLVLAPLALLLASCATMDSHTTQYVGAPHQPPSDPAKVEILRTQPTRPHVQLGEIVVDVSTDPSPPVAEVEQRLRQEAAKIGADAAVVVYDRIQPIGVYVTGGYWSRGVSTITGRKLVGIAIKYNPQ
jgi:hypothetical protein